jgi:CBS domain-containing protein
MLGAPTRRLDVPGYAQAVAEWLDAAALGPVVLAGHSSGTQVAARAAALRPAAVIGLVLASPTVAPIARPLPRLLLRWRLDSLHEPPGLTGTHLREWRRAGLRGLAHLVRVHLRDRIEDAVPEVAAPVLVLRGDRDRLTTTAWAAGLAEAARAGTYRELPGAHTFVWAQPAAWSEPIRRLARDVGQVAGLPRRVGPQRPAPHGTQEAPVATTVAELMARDPQTVEAGASVTDAARRMRDADTGDVLVLAGERLAGIITDRDIVVRVVAEGKDSSTPVGDMCSGQDLVTVTPDARLEHAAELMRERSVRRLPVVEGDRPVGVLSIGDLAIERDEGSALADVSAAEPNQ